MSFTFEQLEALSAPFTPQDHEFLRGFIYLTEGAITKRLDSVDPAWTFEILNQSVRDQMVNTVARLTVCGVFRDCVGTEKINSANEAEKSSATDALKRGARLFGIGRYILDAPAWVKAEADVAKWLNGNSPTERPTQRPTQPPPPAQEGGDFMDTPAKAELSFVFVELKQDKKGEGYLVYQAEKDNTVKVNIFKRQRGMFERVGLASADTLPKNFVGTVERTEDGKFWNLINVASF